jgi:hypothetical protein
MCIRGQGKFLPDLQNSAQSSEKGFSFLVLQPQRLAAWQPRHLAGQMLNLMLMKEAADE